MKHVYKQEGREAGRKHGRIGRKKGLEERKDWKEERIGRKKGLEERKDWKEERIGRKGGTDRRTEEEGEERNGAKEGV